MTGPSFTVQTFNGHDKAVALRSSTLLGLQERAMGKTYTSMHLFAPDGMQEAIGWTPLRFHVEDRGLELLHRSGRFFGQPNTTPPRHALWVVGLLDGHPVGLINTHLINNAWGAPIRGERKLRRRLWWSGWSKVRKLERELTRQGYPPFITGDLNRAHRYWPREPARMIGTGFDRIIYPPTVELLEAWSGDPNGSDHKPVLARFRFKASK